MASGLKRHGTHFAVFVLCMAPALAADDEPKERQYSNGPLTAEDFQAKIPKPRPVAGGTVVQAYSWSEIRYEYSTRFTVVHGKYKNRITEVRFRAVFEPSKSWNARPNDRRLLDHEQGHFDIAQIHALMAQREVNRMIENGSPPMGEGVSRTQSRKRAEEQMRKVVAAITKKGEEAQREYDRFTRHGTIGSAQRKARQQQVNQLKRLRDELAAGETR